MFRDVQVRNQLLRRIQRIPTDKLKLLSDFLSRLEKVPINKKEKIISGAATWKQIDEDLFEGFTDNLIANRERNKRRIDGGYGNPQSPIPNP